jgi:hypothetical protein
VGVANGQKNQAGGMTKNNDVRAPTQFENNNQPQTQATTATKLKYWR